VVSGCSSSNNSHHGAPPVTTPDAGPTKSCLVGAPGCGAPGGGVVPVYAQLDAGPVLDNGCDPLVPQHCGLPFPSNVYLVPDTNGNNPSGMSVHLPTAMLPKSQGKYQLDPSQLYDLDGFSPGLAAVTYLPGATSTGLANPSTIASSVQPDSKTILLNADTGELVPHWVDIDQSPLNDDQRALMVRPAVRLADGTRYIVAIRGVVDASGKVIQPSAAFQALRDGTPSDDPSVNRRRTLYQNIFAKLKAAGIDTSNLQIAWDYTTATRAGTTRWLVHMRDDALAAVGADGPSFVVKSDVENPDPELLRRIIVTMTVPLYLTDGSEYQAGATPGTLVFGADGLPKQNGTMQQDVLIDVPNSVLTGVKHGLCQNGHGLFGSMTEGEDSYLADMADQYHWITFATDLYGFAHADVNLAVAALTTKPDWISAFVERQMQGHVNQLLAMRMMMGRVAKDGIKDASGNLLLDPAWIDSSLRAYRGDSQGGIMGTTYMALSTDVTRGLLGEPGMPYTLLLDRSADFASYQLVERGSYPNGFDARLVMELMQMLWDRSEPDGYAPYLSQNMLPNTPEHHVLIHDALGDQQVTTEGAHVLARTIGAVDLESNDASDPLVEQVYGLTAKPAPLFDQNAIVEYDFGLPPAPLTNEPPQNDCDPHDRVRELTPSYAQSDEFFRTGEIDWFCNGVCNCDGPNEEDGCAASRCN
jgi:hypothetical protein